MKFIRAHRHHKEVAPSVLDQIVNKNRLPPAHKEVPSGIVLEAGFAIVAVNPASHGKTTEIYILQQGGGSLDLSDVEVPAGLDAILELLDGMLEFPHITSGFVLVYDMRSTDSPHLNIVYRMAQWMAEPARQLNWSESCIAWKIIVPEGHLFFVMQLAMGLHFWNNPAVCHTYILTSTQDPREDDVHFEPLSNACTSAEHSSWLTQPHELFDFLGSAFSMLGAIVQTTEAQSWFSEEETTSLEKHGLSGPKNCAHRSRPEFLERSIQDSTLHCCARQSPHAYTDSQNLEVSAVPPPLAATELPECLDVGFVYVTQSVSHKTGKGELRVTSRGGSADDHGIQLVLAFIDGFSKHEHAKEGFAITYDLRGLQLPSMNVVMAIAKWGDDPERVKRWKLLNYACKVVLSAGITFSLAKGVLSTFFLACPPVCRTYLLTDPDEPDDGAYFFEPATWADEDPRSQMTSDEEGVEVNPSHMPTQVSSASSAISEESRASRNLPSGRGKEYLSTCNDDSLLDVSTVVPNRVGSLSHEVNPASSSNSVTTEMPKIERRNLASAL